MTKGQKIRALRERSGKNQVDLADMINVSKQTLYKYENDIITNIPSDKIEAIARIFKVSPAYIMGWEDNTRIIIESSPSPTESVLSDRESAMLNTYRKLEKPRKDAVDQFTDFQYDQQLREARPTLLAAHAHDGADPEAVQADLDIMADDSEWE